MNNNEPQIIGWHTVIPTKEMLNGENKVLPSPNQLKEFVHITEAEGEPLSIHYARTFDWDENKNIHLLPSKTQSSLPSANAHSSIYWMYESLQTSWPEVQSAMEFLDWTKNQLEQLAIHQPLAFPVLKQLELFVCARQEILPIYLEYEHEGKSCSLFVGRYWAASGEALIGFTLGVHG